MSTTVQITAETSTVLAKAIDLQVGDVIQAYSNPLDKITVRGVRHVVGNLVEVVGYDAERRRVLDFGLTETTTVVAGPTLSKAIAALTEVVKETEPRPYNRPAAPAADLTGWAFTEGARYVGEPSSVRLVLVAFAQLAQVALNSPDGYTTTSPAEVARLIGFSEGTVKKHCTTLGRKGSLTRANAWAAYRLPERAFG